MNNKEVFAKNYLRNIDNQFHLLNKECLDLSYNLRSIRAVTCSKIYIFKTISFDRYCQTWEGFVWE